jgi:hypothetical protein
VRSYGVRLALPALLLALLIPTDVGAAEIVKDGSFESTPAGEDNPNWNESGTVAVICDVDTCGDGDGTAGPRTGKNWAFFSGVPTPDLQGVSQEIVMGAPPATLTFWLWVGRANGGANDVLRVLIDDTELFEVLESSTEYPSYKQVTLDVSPYADSTPKDLNFFFDGFGGFPATSFSVDDISLIAGPLGSKAVTLKGPKSVAAGKKAKLTATVSPCAGHEGDTIELYRGNKKVATIASDSSCAARFRVRIKKTSTFQAVSPKQDADHQAGTSKKLRVRARN